MNVKTNVSLSLCFNFKRAQKQILCLNIFSLVSVGKIRKLAVGSQKTRNDITGEETRESALWSAAQEIP